jgi:hypothetical protein
MQRIALDERSARRIALGRMRAHLGDLLDRADSLKLSTSQKGGNAAVRHSVEQAKGFFGPGLIDTPTKGRTVAALGITVVADRLQKDERHALLLVLHNTRSDSRDEATLVIFSGHAVTRAQQRTGHADPVKALAVACAGIDLKSLLSEHATAPDGTELEIKTKTGSLHCVLQPATLICKTFIDAPGQGSAPLRGEV